jgi:hypothetical protein
MLRANAQRRFTPHKAHNNNNNNSSFITLQQKQK